MKSELDVNLVFISVVAVVLVAMGLGVAVLGPAAVRELAAGVVGGGLALLVSGARKEPK